MKIILTLEVPDAKLKEQKLNPKDVRQLFEGMRDGILAGAPEGTTATLTIEE